MFLDLHILSSFAPANLNRDDTGAPKECTFGGTRRARISSQSLKRSIREAFRDQALLPPERMATRTKRVVDLVADQLVTDGMDGAVARSAVTRALRSVGWSISDEGVSDALAFLGDDQVRAIAAAIRTHQAVFTASADATPSADGKKGKAKKETGVEVPPDAVRAIRSAMDLAGSIDLALFGRFIADLPGSNVDGAAYVAHSLGASALDAEVDYFTAVDELNEADETGAGMLGLQGYNASIHYRYSTLDLRSLAERLGDPDLLRLAVEAFVAASITAIPSGKQHSFAAFNKPSFVMAVVRDDAPESLANAYLRPIKTRAEGDQMTESVEALAREWAEHRAMYGSDGIRTVAVAALSEDGLGDLLPVRTTVPTLVTAVGVAAAPREAVAG
jgi:CRISPR system Cascade subunit CasC